MRVTREKAAEHRAAIVAAASRLFRERGFDGVGVAEIMREAGLTHGGFYGHFESKDALAAEACDAAFAGAEARLLPGGPVTDLGRYVEGYLSERHRDSAGRGCPMAANVGEIAHQQEPVQARFAEGVDRYIDALAARLPPGDGDLGGRRARAAALLAALVGGLALARATVRAAPDLSREILDAVRASAAEAGQRPSPDA